MESLGMTQPIAAVDDAELRTQRLIRAGGVGLWDWDLATNELYFSPEWKRQIGYAPDELADEYREWATRLHPADIDATLDAVERFRQGDTSTYDVEFRLRHKDNTYRWIWAQADLLRDEQGRPARMMGSHLDITRRKEAELSLRDSERELRQITDNIQGTISRVGRDLRYLHVNRWYERVFGVRMEDAVGRSMPEVLGEELFNHAEPYIERVLSGETVTFDSVFMKRGILHQSLTTFIPDYAVDGEVAGFFVVGLDVSHLKKVEAALRDSQERMQFALEATSDGVWDWSVAARTVYYSPQWARLLGYAPDEVDESVSFFLGLVHPDDVTRVMAETQQHLDGLTTVKVGEVRLRTKTGEYRWFLDRGKVVARDAQGRALRMVGTISDITERKQNEMERDRLEAQLRQAHKMESIGRLAGGVAHDFNNMLGVILGHTDLALTSVSRGVLVTDVTAELRAIHDAAMRSAGIVRQLLAFARQQQVTLETLDINERVHGMLGLLPRLLGEDIRVETTLQESLWSIRIDRSQVDQILTNLCVNARHAISNVGVITISTDNCAVDASFCSTRADARPGDYVRLTVQDNGCGMDTDTLSHIFEPFFTTNETGEGVGLGLATVFGIVTQHHGFIDVTSRVGHGSTFALYFPRYDGPVSPATPAPSVRPSTAAHETLLLVEDEPALLRIARRMLEGEGYQVLAAATPDEALEIAQKHPSPIDVLVTDVIMPSMNGRDLTACVQRYRPTIVSVYMSGYPADVIASQGGLETGVFFVQKPFAIATLLRTVREAIQYRVSAYDGCN